MSVRKIGAFMGGASQGLSRGVGIAGQAQQQKIIGEADEANKKYYEGLATILDDYQNGRGPWAADQPTPPAAPLQTPPPPSMAPDAAGPPATIGGGDANTLMQRSLTQQQPAAPMAQAAVQAAPQVPGEALANGYAGPARVAQTPRRLPFFQFLGG